MLEGFIIEKIREMEERQREVGLPLYVPDFPYEDVRTPLTQSEDGHRGVVVIDT